MFIKRHNLYVRKFFRGKDYVKPCIRLKNADSGILRDGKNELDSELSPERIAKSIIDIAKNTLSDSQIVAISSIAPRSNNFNIKVKSNFQGTFQNV